MFLELGLPFILRFINDWRAGKTTVKEAVEKVKNVKNGISTEKEVAVPTTAEEAESLFMEKVERELGLPEYNLFSMSPFHLHLIYTRTTIQFSTSLSCLNRPTPRPSHSLTHSLTAQRKETDEIADYAEMITQFGYITIWSLVWPLAPIFALINNYVELRADAVKICKHVRRPVGDRVESIGSWLETLVCRLLSFILPLLFTIHSSYP